jgi:vacuolar protein sorting-associated protein 18
VWRMYLDRNEYELAKKFSRDNPAHHDVVLSTIADDLYNRKQYMESAKLYAQTMKSFEEVTLKFMQTNQNLPLIFYLKKRLNELSIASDQAQIVMLVVWIVDLYLTEMNKSSEGSLERQKEFDEFMQLLNVQNCVKNNKKVIYDIIASHGDNDNLTALTTMNEDYEDVVKHYIQQNEYTDALETLKIQKSANLFYTYAPIIMEELPKEVIQTLIDQGKALNAVKLLPTLLCLKSDKHRLETIKYLEFAIHSLDVRDKSIHNFIIQLYVKHKECEKLMKYLETQGKEVSMINYDIHYALRLCKEFEMKKACVFLLCILEFWQQAVNLALTFDVELAQKTASQPLDRDLKKNLWLIIAEQKIATNENVKETLELLKHCDLLKIEDLLPFFPDFTQIEYFKDAICDSLKEYNRRIQEQKKEMDDCAEAAENVRERLQTLKNRIVKFEASDKCSDCGLILTQKPFVLFPCSHKFHADCLEKALLDLLSEIKFKS